MTTMKPHSQHGGRRLGWLLLAFGATLPLYAQFPGGTAGGGARPSGSSSGSSGSTARTYYGNGTVGEAMISSDPETRRLIVITDEETSRFVGQVVTNLDRPEPQVLIKVVFLEVTYNNASDIGIEGSLTKNLNSTTTGSVSNLFGLATQGIAATAPGMPSGAGLYQVLGNDFQATLRAIAEAGKTEVLSRPSILARNNQPATVLVGQYVPLLSNTSVTLAGTVSTPTYQPVGIQLQVTPFISTSNLVQMMVTPQISALTDQTVNIGPGVNAPVISMRMADTVVVAPDGQTVVIGGLMQNQKIQTVDKIPLLGDIPILGLAFQHKVLQDSKTELIIFLTPHIVREPTQLAGLSAAERRNTQIAPGSFTEEELNRFLDQLPQNGPTPGKKKPARGSPKSSEYSN